MQLLMVFRVSFPQAILLTVTPKQPMLNREELIKIKIYSHLLHNFGNFLKWGNTTLPTVGKN